MKRLKSLIVENIVEEIQRKGVTEQVMQRLMEQDPPWWLTKQSGPSDRTGIGSDMNRIQQQMVTTKQEFNRPKTAQEVADGINNVIEAYRNDPFKFRSTVARELSGYISDITKENYKDVCKLVTGKESIDSLISHITSENKGIHLNAWTPNNPLGLDVRSPEVKNLNKQLLKLRQTAKNEWSVSGM